MNLRRYARTILLPGRWPVEATADNVNTMKMNDKAKAEQMAREKAQAQEIAEKLKDITVEIKQSPVTAAVSSAPSPLRRSPMP